MRWVPLFYSLEKKVMVAIRWCLVLDGGLYASPECLESNNLYLTTIRVFKVMLIYCPNWKVISKSL